MSLVSGEEPAFTFADLFAGIGGFHAAMSASGGRVRFVSEIDEYPLEVYKKNWLRDLQQHEKPLVVGDIATVTESDVVDVPNFDVLCAGFPCQPFSKSGYQLGINETRGTLFFHIEKLLHKQKPSVVFLENVRNLVGPRHRDTWATIIRRLREAGYRVSSEPSILSPHNLPPSYGGTPQSRDRVFILGTYVGRERALSETDVPPTIVRSQGLDWTPSNWNLYSDLILEENSEVLARYGLNDTELRWLEVWEDFLRRFLLTNPGARLPGFPLWEEEFKQIAHIPNGTPTWKKDFLEKNSKFYVEHRKMIDAWRRAHPDLVSFPASRRKFEWQAQGARDFDECVIHFRPSGVRVKRATYVPALVAITQTTILGKYRRRLTPREAAQLQGIDWDFDFGDQPDSKTYKQLGNGVAIGAAYHVFRQHVLNDLDVAPNIRSAVLARGNKPSIPNVQCVAADWTPEMVLVS